MRTGMGIPHQAAQHGLGGRRGGPMAELAGLVPDDGVLAGVVLVLEDPHG